MKKILFFLTIIGLSLTSCSTDEQPTSGENAQTTSVLLDVSTPNTTAKSSISGKDINRNNIPLPVKNVKIVAKHLSSGTEVSDNWNVVTSGGESFLKLSNVKTGNTKFTVTTTTDSPQFKELTNITTTSNKNIVAEAQEERFDKALDNINNEVPYALYTGDLTQVITATDINSVGVNMTTQHGRILTVFQLKDYLKNHADSKDGQGFQAKITATVDGESAQTAITKKNELVTFKWSNTTATSGKKVTYKIEISSINSQNNILETYTITQNIIASTSLSCFYELDFKTFSLTQKEVGINLSWQQWLDQHCTDCNN